MRIKSSAQDGCQDGTKRPASSEYKGASTDNGRPVVTPALNASAKIMHTAHDATRQTAPLCGKMHHKNLRDGTTQGERLIEHGDAVKVVK